MPKLGDIVKGKEIKKDTHRYIWAACVDCGKERWVILVNNKEKFPRCVRCTNRRRIQRGENHPSWKGGKTKNTQCNCSAEDRSNSLIELMEKWDIHIKKAKIVIFKEIK